MFLQLFLDPETSFQGNICLFTGLHSFLTSFAVQVSIMIMKLGQCFFTDIWIFAQIVNCITHQLLIIEIALYFDCPLIHFKFIESLTVEKASDVLISDIIFLQSRLSYHYVLISLSLKYIDIVDIEV